jgi:hypothetical protein
VRYQVIIKQCLFLQLSETELIVKRLQKKCVNKQKAAKRGKYNISRPCSLSTFLTFLAQRSVFRNSMISGIWCSRTTLDTYHSVNLLVHLLFSPFPRPFNFHQNLLHLLNINIFFFNSSYFLHHRCLLHQLRLPRLRWHLLFSPQFVMQVSSRLSISIHYRVNSFLINCLTSVQSLCQRTANIVKIWLNVSRLLDLFLWFVVWRFSFLCIRTQKSCWTKDLQTI